MLDGRELAEPCPGGAGHLRLPTLPHPNPPNRHTHTRCGFAKLSEKPLKLLAAEFEVEMPASATTATDSKEALALALVLRFLEDVSESSAKEIMLDGHMTAETPEQDHLGDISDDLIWDFALSGEQAEVMELVKDWAALRAAKADLRERVYAAVGRVYQKAAQAANAGKKKSAQKKETAKAAKELQDKQRSWYEALSQRTAHMVVSEAPPRAHVHVDSGNGCFRVKMPWTSVKSFSWTKRSEFGAGQLALAQMWSWHEQHTGEAPPRHMTL